MHLVTFACERLSLLHDVLPTLFYNRAPQTVAWELLGKLLVHDHQGT